MPVALRSDVLIGLGRNQLRIQRREEYFWASQAHKAVAYFASGDGRIFLRLTGTRAVACSHPMAELYFVANGTHVSSRFLTLALGQRRVKDKMSCRRSCALHWVRFGEDWAASWLLPPLAFASPPERRVLQRPFGQPHSRSCSLIRSISEGMRRKRSYGPIGRLAEISLPVWHVAIPARKRKNSSESNLMGLIN